MKDRERLWPNCRHCVFYLFKTLSVIFAVDSRHWLFHYVPTCLLIWCFWLRVSVLLIIRLAFCRLTSFAVFCYWVLAFYALVWCCLIFLFFCLLKWLLFWVWAFVDHSFFTPWCFFPPPCFPLCYSHCFCNASWEPGNGIRCRGWGKPHPPYHVLSSALDLERPCCFHHSLIISASIRTKQPLAAQFCMIYSSYEKFCFMSVPYRFRSTICDTNGFSV